MKLGFVKVEHLGVEMDVTTVANLVVATVERKAGMLVHEMAELKAVMSVEKWAVVWAPL